MIEFEGNYGEIVREGIVLVDFSAVWCGPCKMIAPVLEDFHKKRSDIKIVKVDIDKYDELATSLGIMSVPTLILYRNGNMVSKKVGFQTLEMLEEWLS